MPHEKGAALILLGEHRAGVESESKHTGVSRQEDVWDEGLGSQFRLLALAPRILMIADVEVGPAVEAALLHVRKVLGDQIVAELVALLHPNPKSIGAGIPLQVRRIPRARGENLVTGAVGVEAVYGGAHWVLASIDVRPRAD